MRKAVLPAIAGAIGLRSELSGIGFVAGIAILAIAIGAGVAVLRWWRTTYTVGAEDIRLETGVVSRAARSVPYERIQDVSLEQPLLARLLGLTQVRFETGAGGSDEIALAYLPVAEGEALRELVRERRDDHAAVPAAGATAEDANAQPVGAVLFAMKPARVVTFGLFEFSLAAVAVVAGLAQQFDFLLPFDVWDWDEWQGVLGVPVDRLAALGPVMQVVIGLATLAALSVVGFATGILRTALRDWGFVLERTARGFRRRRGLLTTTDMVMPAHRVQALELRTGWLRRRFGWHGLKFVSLAQDAGSGSHVVAPFAQMEELAPIAAAAGFALPGDGTLWQRPARRAFVDRAVLGAAVPILAAAALAIFADPRLALVPLLAVPVIAAGQALAWRRARHALDARQVFTRRGWLAPRIDVAQRVKLQSVEIRQGPLGRRGGYATLHLGLAGGTMAIDALPAGEAQRIRDAVVESVAGLDFSQVS
ncbi:PH domain-containing protein [Altererythrobacter aerius]|uniref:PH domain-containing protein n=2 Tax=Tsuneonella aeria TaxID=1837929 RepID=A0A6I4TET4_9SPHN|nr:PH domain-containing protein [Tsuneonella aeria]MXO75284.1 PH domain-containing protein [Tsuneonella aeria]